jgi:uncharacterized protein DUF4381
MQPDLPLRDIHLPDPIGWWPPAIGWWLLIILIPSVTFLFWWLIKRITRRTALKSARKRLQAIKQESDISPLQTIQQLSALLRRVTISISPRSNSAGLTGSAWLHYLDSSMPDTPFSSGIGQHLAEAHYRRQVPDDIDLPALIALCEQWLKRQKP